MGAVSRAFEVNFGMIKVVWYELEPVARSLYWISAGDGNDLDLPEVIGTFQSRG